MRKCQFKENGGVIRKLKDDCLCIGVYLGGFAPALPFGGDNSCTNIY